MRILFTADPEPHQIPRGEYYVAGEVYDLTADQANRWIRRGIAVEAPVQDLPASPGVEAAPSGTGETGAALQPPVGEDPSAETDVAARGKKT